MKNLVHIRGQVAWEVSPSKGGYLAVCPTLKLSLEGKSFGELMQLIAEGLDLFLRDLCRSGELEAFLREQKWSATESVPQRTANVRFDLPFIPRLNRRFRHDQALAFN